MATPEVAKPSLAGGNAPAQSASGRPSHETDLTSSKSSHDLDPEVEKGVPVIDTSQDADEKVGIERVVSVTNDNTVDWNDSSDIRRPINWTVKKKWANCSIISVLTFLTPLASSMVAPAVPLIMQDFGSSDSTLASFIVSIYILGYAIGEYLA